MIYRRRGTPLHAARAAVGCGYCLALAFAALIVSSPVVLGGLIGGLIGAGTLAGSGREARRALLWSLPAAAAIALINMIVSQQGLTVIARLGSLPLLGRTDVTLEATVYGGVLALRWIALILCGVLYTTAVDPDEVLHLFRRISFRSALAATLATRMVPVLIRDGGRLADARRCRPGRPPSRLALIRATTSGVLDRALDVAAALEVRGYGAVRSPAAHSRPLSRHDLAFALAAVAIIVLVGLARYAPLAPFRAYPTLHAPVGVSALACAVGLAALALAPFAQRRGIDR